MDQRKQAFTRAEIITIVASTFLFGMLVLPALAKSRTTGRATVCLSRHGQLMAAWQMYASDWREEVSNNYTIPETQSAIIQGRLDNWANNVMTWSVGGLEANSTTNETLVRDGVLAKYSSEPVRMYKCPSDHYLSQAQLRAGWKERLRSFGMNALVGRSDTSPTTSTGRSWYGGGSYRQFLKLSDIPSPSMTWVTIDEHADSVNDGFFVMAHDAPSWADVPAAYHNGAGAFGYADGRAELKQWKSMRLALNPVRAGGLFTTVSFDAAGREDFAWYKERTAFIPYR